MAGRSPPNGPFRRQPRATAAASVDDFPTLLDRHQWTQGATISQHTRWEGPSGRIGRYYRQGLNELNESELEAKHEQRMQPSSPLRPTVERTGWAPGLTCRTLLDPLQADAGPSSGPLAASSSSGLAILGRQRAAERAKAHEEFAGTHRQLHITDQAQLGERFAAYVNDGIDDSTIAPFNDTWALNALEQVPRDVVGVSAGRVEGLINEMLGEVQEQYYEAVKTSVVRCVLRPSSSTHRSRRSPRAPAHPRALPSRSYVLRNANEAARVEITQPPRPFAVNTFHPSQDQSVAACATSHEGSLELGEWRVERLEPPCPRRPPRTPPCTPSALTDAPHSCAGTPAGRRASSAWAPACSSTTRACCRCSTCGCCTRSRDARPPSYMGTASS